MLYLRLLKHITTMQNIPRGKGAIICMKETLSAVDSDNYIIPVWMI